MSDGVREGAQGVHGGADGDETLDAAAIHSALGAVERASEGRVVDDWPRGTDVGAGGGAVGLGDGPRSAGGRQVRGGGLVEEQWRDVERHRLFERHQVWRQHVEVAAEGGRAVGGERERERARERVVLERVRDHEERGRPAASLAALPDVMGVIDARLAPAKAGFRHLGMLDPEP